MELMRRIRDLAARLEYFEAGRDAEKWHGGESAGQRRSTGFTSTWGVEEIRGLELDEVPATVEAADRPRPGGAVRGSPGGSQSGVRTERERKKKLIVAFHFQFANESQAGPGGIATVAGGTVWRVKRRCGFLASEQRGEARIVWGRHGAQAEECPKSLITGREP